MTFREEKSRSWNRERLFFVYLVGNSDSHRTVTFLLNISHALKACNPLRRPYLPNN
ncbi:hypothetical protein BURPS305_6974 [Burkholderia pseudomallei 305]|uniref:Uncharacterized protein n=1 Tax=Burkholderia pseudomallei 1710a TaxID=320371 RepID=A0A0E1W474_BURPE|nr:hypothetical protein GBP346_A2434 [Burkholderia pseudomallei MSHR346]EBA50876.1 hypothetical protein BURPS305_6974 [Burkholderia pseudomallei 305]EET07086.1 hypothetical protein BURPS1710A_2864 [Burkholderia pseudomallei 1710a]KOT20822.1 hypothetical protein DM52_1096 [Burkholderia mallei]